MTNIKPLFMFAIAITGAMTISGDCSAQGCPSCAAAPSEIVATGVSYPIASCGDCGTYGCDGGCQSGRVQGVRADIQARREHTKARCKKVCARNRAWPMPFDCADRQLYFSMFEAMIDRGFEEQCVLTSAHFNEKTGELNHFGVHTVAGIMQNMPSDRREVFIHRDADKQSNDARLAAVKRTIETYYANAGPARVSFSNQLPTTLRGTKADSISQLWFDNQPTPVIKISSGQSVSGSIQQ